VLRCESLRADKAFRLLALDFFFDDMSSALDTSSQTAVLSSLELFYEYSLLIRDARNAAVDKAPWDSPWLSKLFQFERDGEGVRIRPGTFIYEDYKARGFSLSQSVELPGQSVVSLSRQEFTRNLSRLLSELLDSRIRDKDGIVSRPRLFDPCVYALHNTCRSNHSLSHQLDQDWFNRRVRFHLQHIMILDNLYAFRLMDFPTRVKGQR
jgi:hypothetical protein